MKEIFLILKAIISFQLLGLQNLIRLGHKKLQILGMNRHSIVFSSNIVCESGHTSSYSIHMAFPSI